MTERRADDATREVDAWLKCEFLKDRIGEEFDGVIAADHLRRICGIERSVYRRANARKRFTGRLLPL